MGYLPQAMVNYLALLGWGDGTENEFFTLKQLGWLFSWTYIYLLVYSTRNNAESLGDLFLTNFLFAPEISVEKFTIERVNKSGAIFDSTKLR